MVRHFSSEMRWSLNTGTGAFLLSCLIISSDEFEKCFEADCVASYIEEAGTMKSWSENGGGLSDSYNR